MNNKLVLFWAEGCEPCSHMRPIVAKVSKEMKLPLDEYNMVTPGIETYARDYGVKGWPHLLIVKDDVVVEEIVGYDLSASNKVNKDRLTENIARSLGIPVPKSN
jgi:thiol-disulfide isomerase/thioredoxin